MSIAAAPQRQPIEATAIPSVLRPLSQDSPDRACSASASNMASRTDEFSTVRGKSSLASAFLRLRSHPSGSTAVMAQPSPWRSSRRLANKVTSWARSVFTCSRNRGSLAAMSPAAAWSTRRASAVDPVGPAETGDVVGALHRHFINKEVAETGVQASRVMTRQEPAAMTVIVAFLDPSEHRHARSGLWIGPPRGGLEQQGCATIVGEVAGVIGEIGQQTGGVRRHCRKPRSPATRKPSRPGRAATFPATPNGRAASARGRPARSPDPAGRPVLVSRRRVEMREYVHGTSPFARSLPSRHLGSKRPGNPSRDWPHGMP